LTCRFDPDRPDDFAPSTLRDAPFDQACIDQQTGVVRLNISGILVEPWWFLVIFLLHEQHSNQIHVTLHGLNAAPIGGLSASPNSAVGTESNSRIRASVPGTVRKASAN